MSDTSIHALFLTNFVSSFIMVGLIWFVQIVHYPLLASVGQANFPTYMKRHSRIIKWVVGPPMLVEGGTAAALLWFHPAGFQIEFLMLGSILLAAIWLSTVFVQVPCHRILSRGFDLKVHQSLVSKNWIRTICWSLRGTLVLWMAWTSMVLSESTTMAKIKVGDPAPEFVATTSDGRQISMSDYRGKRGVVIFFYPKNGTPVCTKEACAFRDSYEKFTDAGVDLIGISSDSDESHRAFARQHKLPFPLISDTNGTLRQAFTVSKTLGIIPGRVTYVIDNKGIVRLIYSAQLASDEHVHQALTAIRSEGAPSN